MNTHAYVQSPLTNMKFQNDRQDYVSLFRRITFDSHAKKSISVKSLNTIQERYHRQVDRTAANFRERKRMSLINNAFTSLYTHLPSELFPSHTDSLETMKLQLINGNTTNYLHNKPICGRHGISKVDILRAAIDYIQALSSLVQELRLVHHVTGSGTNEQFLNTSDESQTSVLGNASTGLHNYPKRINSTKILCRANEQTFETVLVSWQRDDSYLKESPNLTQIKPNEHLFDTEFVQNNYDPYTIPRRTQRQVKVNRTWWPNELESDLTYNYLVRR